MYTLLNGEIKKTLNTSLANEWGILARDITNLVQCADKIIAKAEVPTGRKVTYGIICDYGPLKNDIWLVLLTVVGDQLEYPYEAASHSASLIETKLIFNSTISDAHKDARFMTLDIKDFFPKTPYANSRVYDGTP